MEDLASSRKDLFSTIEFFKDLLRLKYDEQMINPIKRQITLFKENQSRKDLFSNIEFFKDLYLVKIGKSYL